MKTIGNKKVLTFFTVVGLLLSVDLSAQDQNGLFGNAAGQTKDDGLLGRANRAQNGMDWQGGGLTPQDPTQEAPLGSGWMLLVAAGVSYAALKTKRGKEDQK